jgi:N,N'-diacetyllegionaminate synthase
MEKIKIGNKWAGDEEPCFIIAEAGVNHNGKLELAKKLVDAAGNAGADAVKFQTYKAEKLVTKDADATMYQVKNMREKKSQLDMLDNLALEYKEFIVLKKYCDRKGILFLSTPHSFDAIDFLEELVPVYKFGSGDLTNIPSLKYAAKKEKPMILGTGMSTLEEVRHAVDAIKSEGNDQIVVLHCTTNYPCPLEEVNLQAMKIMKNELKCLVGYSDHTLGNIVPIAAVAMGACMIEKHFTLNRELPGPDHRASLEPNELKEMIQVIRETEKAMGNGIKKPTKSEDQIKKSIRKSIVAKVNIPKGTIITREMMEIKRPGMGISPDQIDKIIGGKARDNIKKDELIRWDKIEM